MTPPSREEEPPSSSGLGRLPFTQVTRVQIPLGVQNIDRVWNFCSKPRWSCGAVWSARRPVKPEVAGSNPVRTATVAHPNLGGYYGVG